MEKVIDEEINYHGVSVIICRRECIQTARRHAAAAAKKKRLNQQIIVWKRKI